MPVYSEYTHNNSENIRVDYLNRETLLKISKTKHFIYNHQQNVNNKLYKHFFGQMPMKRLLMMNHFKLIVEK